MAELPISEGAKSLIQAVADSLSYGIEIGVMPDSPDNVFLINDTGGAEPNPKWLLDFPTLQIQARGTVSTYRETWQAIKKVKDVLLGCDSRDVNGDRWVSVNMLSDIAFIGRDEDNRPMFTINLSLIIEPQVPTGDSNREAL